MTSLSFEERSELDVREEVLSAVTPAARGHDVLDRIRAASRERDAVIRLKRSFSPAIGASSTVLVHKGSPLDRRVPTVRTDLSSAAIPANGPADLRMRGRVSPPARFGEIRVRIVPRIPLAPMLVRMRRAPPAHGFTRFLRVLTHPLSTVRTSAVRILVWHGRPHIERPTAWQ
ncbi:MAG TPA: hypothetical protein VI814_04995 [Candidatus Limnocylindria bacterium]